MIRCRRLKLIASCRIWSTSNSQGVAILIRAPTSRSCRTCWAIIIGAISAVAALALTPMPTSYAATMATTKQARRTKMRTHWSRDGRTQQFALQEARWPSRTSGRASGPRAIKETIRTPAIVNGKATIIKRRVQTSNASTQMIRSTPASRQNPRANKTTRLTEVDTTSSIKWQAIRPMWMSRRQRRRCRWCNNSNSNSSISCRIRDTFIRWIRTGCQIQEMEAVSSAFPRSSPRIRCSRWSTTRSICSVPIHSIRQTSHPLTTWRGRRNSRCSSMCSSRLLSKSIILPIRDTFQTTPRRCIRSSTTLVPRVTLADNIRRCRSRCSRVSHLFCIKIKVAWVHRGSRKLRTHASILFTRWVICRRPRWQIISNSICPILHQMEDCYRLHRVILTKTFLDCIRLRAVRTLRSQSTLLLLLRVWRRAARRRRIGQAWL